MVASGILLLLDGLVGKAKTLKKKRRREFGAARGAVNRPVLNSNNVGSSKHLTGSERKPRWPGCWWQWGCFPRSDGRTAGGWTPTEKRGWNTNTNKHSRPPLTLRAAGSEFWTTSRTHVDKNFRGLLLSCWQLRSILVVFEKAALDQLPAEGFPQHQVFSSVSKSRQK